MEVFNMNLYPDFYNDVFGPIMQPGSSSSTAGPCHVGYLANCLLGEKPVKVRVLMDTGSTFAQNFGHYKQDVGLLAGAIGILPGDIRLFDSKKIADREGIEYRFDFGEMKESDHLNGMKFFLAAKSGKSVTLVGDSTGGGMVETRMINGFPLRVKGDTYVLLIFDYNNRLNAGAVDAFLKSYGSLVESGMLEANGGRLFYAKITDEPDLEAVRKAFPESQTEMLRPILVVMTSNKKKPQLFDSMTKWREFATKNNMSLSDAAIQYEIDSSGWTREQIIERMKFIKAKMHRQCTAIYERTEPFVSNKYSGNHYDKWDAYQKKGRVLCGSVMAQTVRGVLGARTYQPGVEFVPGPMGAGGGYIYAAMYAVQQSQGFSDDDFIRGLFIAAGIGAIAYTRSHPTGEGLGCTGECGICGTMAAGAITEMAGGTPEQVENAASLILQAFIGIPCDTMPGGCGQPCRSRSLTAACMAIVLSDFALSGRDAILPYHEALDVANTVSDTSRLHLGKGCCEAPTAKRIKEEFDAWYKTQH